jgi:hypothetical protein
MAALRFGVMAGSSCRRIEEGPCDEAGLLVSLSHGDCPDSLGPELLQLPADVGQVFRPGNQTGEPLDLPGDFAAFPDHAPDE